MGRGARTDSTATAGTDIRSALRNRAAAQPVSAAQVWERQQSGIEEHSAEWAQMVWDQKRLGGKPYRINDARMDALRVRIDKLNKKAARMGATPIELRVTTEQQQQITPDQRIADWTYVVVASNPGPVVPGYAILAALDHNRDSAGNAPAVAIRRVPEFATVHDLDPEELARLREVDIDSFHQCENRCEHCDLKRKRNTTYLMFEKASGRVVQVGSDCMSDFTGAENPEKALRWAEELAALDSDLQAEAHEAAGRVAIPTGDFIANAIAVARDRGGYQKRWEDGYRLVGTADHAHTNMTDPQVTVTDEDRKLAAAALDWARDELGQRENLSDFEQNLVTYAAGDYLGQKGDGMLAYLPEAYQRHQRKQAHTQAVAASEFVGAEKQRIKGLELNVQSVHISEGRYGTSYITRMTDQTGNCFLWYGSSALDKGKRYRMDGTVKRHELDSRNQDAKTTVLTNCRSITPA